MHEGDLVCWKQHVLGWGTGWARVIEDIVEACIMWGCEELHSAAREEDTKQRPKKAAYKPGSWPEKSVLRHTRKVQPLGSLGMWCRKGRGFADSQGWGLSEEKSGPALKEV